MPNSSKLNFKSAIRYPLFINLSKKNNSGLLFIDLINATKFLSKIGLVDISICEVTNLLLINEFSDIWVLIYSSSIGLPIKLILASIVFTLILKILVLIQIILIFYLRN